MDQIVSFAEGHLPWLVPLLLLLSVFVEISPIKINPLTWIVKKIGHVLMEDTNKRIDNLEKNVEDMKNDSANNKVENIRWNILDFSNSCRNGRRHTRSEWEHVLQQIDDYNKYVKANNIINGVLDSEEKYLIQLFQERLKHNDFL